MTAPKSQPPATSTKKALGAGQPTGEFRPPRVFTNHHDLLAIPDLDLVDLLLPHHLHYPVTLDALAAGKHVSVQKPIALSLVQADEMIAAVQTADRTLRVYENFIFYPSDALCRDGQTRNFDNLPTGWAQSFIHATRHLIDALLSAARQL